MTTSDEQVIVDGLTIPSVICAEQRDDAGRTVRVIAEYSAVTGRYECRDLRITSESPTPEITGESIRSLPIHSWVVEAAQGALGDAQGMSVPRPAAGKVTDEFLAQAARVYRRALLVGRPPVDAVMTGLGLPRTTASRWITRARDRGLLTVRDPRGRRTGG